jgi:exodeoxyribonuclease-3
MKLATWNCNGALRRKLSQADSLDADLLVIQECEDPTQSTPDYREWAGDHGWIGYGKHKGASISPAVAKPSNDWNGPQVTSRYSCPCGSTEA